MKHLMAEWGIEAMASAFGIFNGIRLINLSQRSLFQPFVYTETVQSAVEYLRKRADAARHAAEAATVVAAPPPADPAEVGSPPSIAEGPPPAPQAGSRPGAGAAPPAPAHP